MKLFSATSALAGFISIASVNANANGMGTADAFYHNRQTLGPAIWSFGKTGVSMFSLDGSKVLKRHSNADICGGEECGFKESVSDGKRYVFATNTLLDTLDVFSISSGDFVASIEVCGFPWALDYHPIRDEVWVHCWSPDEAEGDVGHVSVISAGAINTPTQHVMIKDTLENHAHGSVLVDSSLGHIGYSTDLNNATLFSVDLNTKDVIEAIPVPDVSGLYRMAYSHVNQHIYLRAYVCCSCGFDGADLPTCGRGGGKPVDITTGPSAGSLGVEGSCGHGCEGSVADTIGVMEFDTKTNRFVKNWQMKEGFGADPYVSPYGDHIALFGNNGGKTVRILKPAQNGNGSKLWADVDVGFHTEDQSTTKSVSDAVFIQDSNHNIAIFSSTLSNSIAIVDMSSDNPVVNKLLLTDGEDITSNHGRGARRNVVWAVGTNYVWVDGEKNEEFYLIELSPDGDINKAKVKNTIAGIGVRNLLYVENYFASTSSTKVEEDIMENIRISEANRSADKTIDGVGTSGLIVGGLALVIGVINMLTGRSKSSGGEDDESWKKEQASLPSQV